MKKWFFLLIFIVLAYSKICFAQGNYYLLEFAGPVMPEWKSELSERGVVFSSYIPDYSFIVTFDPAVKQGVESLDFVASVSPYNPKVKFDPSISRKLSSSSTYDFYVLIHEGSDVNVLLDEFSKLNVKVSSVSENRLKVSAKYSQLDSIAGFDFVSWVEEAPRYVVVNDIASGIISANFTWNSYGLSGVNQSVAISDSGLDTGSNDNLSEDFRGKVVIVNLYGASADDVSGHGTHTAGSLAGSANNSFGQFKGIVYNAEIFFQAIGDDAGSTAVYPPTNLSDLFIQAYENGSRVHSNSWGSDSGFGNYVTDSQTVDDFMWNYTDFLVVFAAGNKGSAVNTVEFPSTAKNCLSVGASENNRTDRGSSSDNINEVASFSSHGPADDGRVKPDLVAPGTSIVSAKSSLGVTSCTSSYESNGNYSYCQGTSMATPLAAGAAALVREHYLNLNVNPSAALLKATLINGAMDLGYGIPSNETGWGRINLSESLHPAKPRVVNYTDYSSGLSTGESISYNFTVYNESSPVKVTVVWTDYPGSPSAAKALVNDLNLVVTSCDGSVFNGNDYVKPFYDQVDDTNNVEQVNISNVSMGSYLVNVSAFNVPNGPQPFALVVSGPVTSFINLLTGDNSAFNSMGVFLNFSVDDSYNESNCSLFLNDEFNQSLVMAGAESFFELNLSDGSYNWSVQCFEGTFNAASDVLFFVVDSSPSIIVTSPENLTYPSSSVDLNFSVDSFDSCWYNLGSGNISLVSCANTTLALAESSYLIYVYANNTNGLENFSSVAFRVDITYPEISLVSPSDSSSWTSSNSVDFSFNVSDSEIDSCNLFVDNVVVLTNDSADVGQQYLTYTLSNGVYNWSVSCSDSAGNLNSSPSYSLTVSYAPTQSASPGGGGGGGGGGGSRVVACEESWSCSSWSGCVSNSQARDCVDLNDCGTSNKKPITYQVCVSEPSGYVVEQNKIQELSGATVAEKPKTIQSSFRLPDYQLNKLYFFGPLALILFIILTYIIYKNFLLKK